MTVYLDVLILVNLYLDFFLLWAVRRFLGLRAGTARLVLGAAAGAACAPAALLPAQGPLALLIALAAALVTAAAAFAPLPPGQFARAAGCLFLFSLLLAGLFLFLLRFFTPRGLAVFGSVVYIDLSLPLLFVFTCGAYGVLSLARRLLPWHRAALRCGRLTVEQGGASVRLFARADTGDQLREPFSGLPVIVCERRAVAALFPGGFSPEQLPGLRLVPFQTLGARGLLPAFRPARLLLDGQPVEAYLALTEEPLSEGRQFDALFNPDLLSAPAPVRPPRHFFRRS